MTKERKSFGGLYSVLKGTDIKRKLRMMSKYGVERTLLCDSVHAFYIVYSLLILSLVFHTTIGYNISLIVGIVYLLLRYIYRYPMVKKSEFIKIKGNSIDFRDDQRIRANNLGDIVGLMVYSLFIITSWNPYSILPNDTVYVFSVFVWFYFTVAYFSVYKNKVILKILAVLCSTLQGIMMIAVVIIYIIERVSLFLRGTELYGASVMSIVTNDTDVAEVLILISGLLEQFPVYTFGAILISCFLLGFLIFMTPIYQLPKLRLAFQITNILVVMTGIIFALGAEHVSDFWADNQTLLMDSDFYKEFIVEIPNGEVYFNSFGTNNIKDMIYLALMPYTVGILIASVVMEKRVDNAKIKADNILLELRDISKRGENEVQIQRKKYYALGGKKLIFDLYEKNYCIHTDLKDSGEL